ncbi:MAG: MATE family efflux transporter [Clostridia bacterium]|nr:MATE family efflux transporter [Clostridia bacterium]
MAANTKDLTTGSIKKVLLSFAAPLFLSQLFQQLYNSADALIVGNFLGKEALAAVSSSGPLIHLFIGFFNGAATGAGVVISRYFGAQDRERVRKAIHTNVLFSLFCGLFLSLVGVLLTPHILRWMGTDPDVLPLSESYFRWYFAGAAAIVMYNVLKGVMTALGDSRRPLYYLIFSSVLNVLLDLLFVGALHGGVAAAALATTLSQGISAMLCLVHLLQRDQIYTLKARELKIDSAILREILRIGLPTGVQMSVISIANVLVQRNINSFGADAMAACGSYAKVEGFVFMPITCFSLALTTFISQNLGAGQLDRVKAGSRFGLLASVLAAESIGAAVFLLGPRLIGLFNSDPAVLAIGQKQCTIESLFFCMLAFSHTVAGICRGAGRAAVPMLVMLGVWCVLRIAYITIAMSLCHDIRLLFWAYPITWTISAAIFFLYYKRSNWLTVPKEA